MGTGIRSYLIKGRSGGGEEKEKEMLIGGDDISNDVITLGTCFLMFVYIHARFRFELIGRNLTGQSTGSQRGIGRGIQNSRDVVASYPSFSRPAARAPKRACSQAIKERKMVFGSDGKIRVLPIRVQSKTFRLPVQKLNH